MITLKCKKSENKSLMPCIAQVYFSAAHRSTRKWSHLIALFTMFSELAAMKNITSCDTRRKINDHITVYLCVRSRLSSSDRVLISSIVKECWAKTWDKGLFEDLRVLLGDGENLATNSEEVALKKCPCI